MAGEREDLSGLIVENGDEDLRVAELSQLFSLSEQGSLLDVEVLVDELNSQSILVAHELADAPPTVFIQFNLSLHFYKVVFELRALEVNVIIFGRIYDLFCLLKDLLHA